MPVANLFDAREAVLEDAAAATDLGLVGGVGRGLATAARELVTPVISGACSLGVGGGVGGGGT